MVEFKRVPDASEFAGFIYGIWATPLRCLRPTEFLLRYYAVRVFAFKTLYGVPLNRAINLEIKIAKQRHGTNMPFEYTGRLFVYTPHQLETMFLTRLGTARKFYKRFEWLINRYHRKFG